MEIIICNTKRTVASVFKDFRHTSSTFDYKEFTQLKAEFEKLSEENGAVLKSESDSKHEIKSNSEGRAYYGGGQEIFTIIDRLSLYAGSVTVFIKLLKALSPIIEKYIDKKAGTKITIKTENLNVSVENKNDLDLAIGKAMQMLEEAKTTGADKKIKKTKKNK